MLSQQSPTAAFKSLIVAALPSEDRLHQQLQTLPDELWSGLGRELAGHLEGAEVVVALPHASVLGQAVAQALGRPLVVVAGPDPEALRGHPQAVLVTSELLDGVQEMELCVLGQRVGCEIRTVACALERTTSGGRYHLLQLGVKTVAAVRLAQLTDGLILERRSVDRPPR